MEQLLNDTAGMGALLWLAGHLAFYGRVLPPLSYAFRGRGVLLLCIPSAVWITLKYFTGSGLSFRYYTASGELGHRYVPARLSVHRPFGSVRSGTKLRMCIS